MPIVSLVRADLFGGRILHGANEMADLVAHRLGSDASGRRLEVDVTCAANSRVERVAARHQRVRHIGRATISRRLVFCDCSDIINMPKVVDMDGRCGGGRNKLGGRMGTGERGSLSVMTLM